MKCPYDDFDCDWPEETGDIECAECIHYKAEVNSTSFFDWIKNLFAAK